jgi:hypothetical protein
MKVAIFASLLIIIMLSMEQSFGSTLFKFEIMEESKENTVESKEKTICPDGGICPGFQTCCPIGGGHYGCCIYTSASCCADLMHCRPAGQPCSSEDLRSDSTFQSLIASLPSKEKIIKINI